MFKSFKKETTKPEDYLKNIKEGTPSHRIISKEVTVNASFDVEEVKQQDRRKKIVKYLPNPEKFWGPKARGRINKE